MTLDAKVETKLEAKLESEAAKDTLKVRLRRVEGQVRGVQKMVDDNRDCHEILQQLAAIRAAVQNASELFLQTYAKECLARTDQIDGAERDALIDNVMKMIIKIR